MILYTILALPEKIVQHVRTTLTDPIYRHPVQISVAGPGDYGPCRSCLRTFSIGERRILFLYNPFSPNQEADFAGPIFIHDQNCTAYEANGKFPELIRSLPLTLRGYDQNKQFLREQRPQSLDVEETIEALFQDPEVAFIHVRNEEAKCFILHIARA